ncbi:17542_t:CDS:1, partial [Funneliformis geosporum]
GEPDEVERQDTQEDIYEECSVRKDLERSHKNRSLMSKWVGKVPHPDNNPKYAFIQPIADLIQYKKSTTYG